MKTPILRIYGILWSTVVVGLLIAACGSSNQVTYRVGGEAAEASISYRDAEGQTQEETVNLPWETSMAVGNKFNPELIVTSKNPPETVTCEIWLNERQLGDRESLAYAVCNASFSKSGNSTSSSFAGSSVEVYLKQAEEATNDGDYEQALSNIEKALEVTPNYADVHFVQGIVYKNMDESDKALAAYNQTIELDPEHVGAFNNRGRVYMEMDELDMAIADWTTAVKLDPNYVNGYYNRAIAYVELGDMEAAIADLKKLQELSDDPDTLAWAEEALAELENITADITISTADLERYTHNLDCAPYNEDLILKSFSVLYPGDFEITDCREYSNSYVTFELKPDGNDSDFAFVLGHFTIEAAPGEFETQYNAKGDELLNVIGPQFARQLNGKLIDDTPMVLQGTKFYRRDYEAEMFDIPRLVRLVTIPNFDTGQGLLFLALKKVGTTPENEYPVFDEFSQQIITSVEFPPATTAAEEKELPPGNSVTVSGSLGADDEAVFLILGSTNATILATVDPKPGFELELQQATTDQVVASSKDGDNLLAKLSDPGLYRIVVRNTNTNHTDFNAAFLGTTGIAFALYPHYKTVGRLPEGKSLSYTYTGPGGSNLKVNITPHTDTPLDLVVKIFNIDNMKEPLLEINETGLSEGELVDFTLPEGSGAALDTYLMTVEDAAGNPGKYLLVIKTE